MVFQSRLRDPNCTFLRMAPDSDDTLLEARRMRLQELANLQLCFLAKCAAEPLSHLEILVALLLRAFSECLPGHVAGAILRSGGKPPRLQEVSCYLDAMAVYCLWIRHVAEEDHWSSSHELRRLQAREPDRSTVYRGCSDTVRRLVALKSFD